MASWPRSAQVQRLGAPVVGHLQGDRMPGGHAKHEPTGGQIFQGPQRAVDDDPRRDGVVAFHLVRADAGHGRPVGQAEELVPGCRPVQLVVVGEHPGAGEDDVEMRSGEPERPPPGGRGRRRCEAAEVLEVVGRAGRERLRLRAPGGQHKRGCEPRDEPVSTMHAVPPNGLGRAVYRSPSIRGGRV
jgi:hypothetical protein